MAFDAAFAFAPRSAVDGTGRCHSGSPQRGLNAKGAVLASDGAATSRRWHIPVPRGAAARTSPRSTPRTRCETRLQPTRRGGTIQSPRGTGTGPGVSRTPRVATPVVDGGKEVSPVGELHVALEVNGEHREVDVEPQTSPRPGAQGGPRPHRDARRLRHQPVRRVHRPRRRPGREELHDARRPGRRRERHDDRGHGRRDGALHPLQNAFWEKHGLQCGFCTPGMIMAAADLLKTQPAIPTRRRDPARDRGQHLPLHRLPQHRAGHPRGGPRDARGCRRTRRRERLRRTT